MISIHNEVEKVVLEMTKNRRLFTAHDVTKVVRHNVDGDKVFHNDVKREVHAIYENDEMGIYTRTQISLGGNASPFVYHLNHQDPDTDYNKDWVNTTLQLSKKLNVNPITGGKSRVKVLSTVGKSTRLAPCKIGSAIVAQPVTQTDDGDYHISDSALQAAAKSAYEFDSNFVTRDVTKEGRLAIPKKMLRHIDSAHLTFETSKATINQNYVNALFVSKDAQNPLKSYKANKDGRFRISDKFLSKLDSNGTYRIKKFCNTIVIIAD